MNYSKKVLVTGATGLIGKELIKPLTELGFKVYAITIDENNPDNGVTWLKGNLFDYAFIKAIMQDIKPEYLLNMAWATTGDYLTSDINYKFLEVGKYLLEEFAKNGGKRAIFAGTCFEYKFKDTPLNENDDLDYGKTVYTSCKHKLHKFAEEFCAKNNISFGYGRVFYVFGNGESPTRLTGMLLDKFSNDQQVIINSGMLIKDYLYTKDIAGAFAKFLNSNVEGVVNICSANPITIKEYCLRIADKMGKTELLIFEDKVIDQPLFIVGDNKRLLDEVGYDYQFTFDEAIEDLLCLAKI